jgi:hypothetical protein
MHLREHGLLPFSNAQKNRAIREARALKKAASKNNQKFPEEKFVKGPWQVVEKYCKNAAKVCSL